MGDHVYIRGLLLWKYSNNKAELHIGDNGYNSYFADACDIGIFEALQEKEVKCKQFCDNSPDSRNKYI